MPKIASGACGATSSTSSRAKSGPEAGLGSPLARRSRTVEPSLNATTRPSRTSPLSRSPAGDTKEASFIAAQAIVAPARRAGRASNASDVSAARAAALAASRRRQRPGRGTAPVATIAALRALGVVALRRLGKPLALGVGHLADDERSVVDLLLDAIQLRLALCGLALPLGLRRHVQMATPRRRRPFGRCRRTRVPKRLR